MWAITATYFYHEEGYNSTGQLPTFYLHPHVQGILTETHAIKVARAIIDPDNRQDGWGYQIAAVWLEV